MDWKSKCGSVKVLSGDCRERLRDLPAESVQCVVTSPPYWGLRDYGTGQWEGGEEGCDHIAAEIRTRGSLAEWSEKHARGGAHAVPEKLQYRDVCGKCGAKRIDQQLGSESTPEEFVANLVAVFREVWRVLRKDGVIFVNLGDSYASSLSDKRGTYSARKKWQHGADRVNDSSAWESESRAGAKDLTAFKPKDLCGIPWRVAFALQGFAVVPFKRFSDWADELAAARDAGDWEAVAIVEAKLRAMDLLAAMQASGWYLRSEIIWHKPNPMPESVRDRPTKSHEQVFLLAKSGKYFYDCEAIKEPAEQSSIAREKRGVSANHKTVNGAPGQTPHSMNQPREHDSDREVSQTRNKRSVWTIATKSYKEAHFATYPPALVEPCILAGTSERGCCVKCGAPWERVVESGESSWEARKAAGHKTSGYHAADGPIASFPTPKVEGRKNEGGLGWVADKKTIGWQPTCDCEAGEPVPCTVLDPFGGSGTTAEVAMRLGRNAILCELNHDYIDLIKNRAGKEAPAERFPLFGT